MARCAVAALAALALLASRADGAGAATRVGFWAGEAVPGTNWGAPETYWNRRDTRAYTPGLWKVLSENRIPLYFNLRYRRDFGPVPAGRPHRRDGLAILRKANRLGVPVWAWVLVPYTNGYWAWDGSATEQFAAVKALVRWAQAKRVKLRGLALDPEPPVGTPSETPAAILGGDGGALPALFERTIDPAGQCTAWHTYARMLRWAKRNRVRIAAAPLATALDDIEDGSLALQDASQFVLPSGPWHELYFQAYRSVFAYHGGQDPGPGIVPSYLRSARRAFGRAGQVSLGSTGRGAYKRFRNLVHDVRLAATLGARTLPIYSLERTLRSYGGPRALLRLVRAANRPFTGTKARTATSRTSRASALRASIRLADAAATAATPTVTTDRGLTQAPNAWPDGCVNWTVLD